jgi:hypothetical protein
MRDRGGMSRMVKNVRALALGTGIAFALAPGVSEAQTVEDAKVFVHDMVLNQNVGIPRNGSVDIDDAAFNDDCTLFLTGQSRQFVIAVNFKKAALTPLESVVPTDIVIDRGVTVYKNGHLLQSEDSSTVKLSFYTIDLAPRMFKAMTVLHDQCYGGGYKF